MPRDSNGNYTLPPGNPVVSGTPITTLWANPTMADIAAELTNSLSRTGEGGMLVPFKNADGTIAAPGITWNNEPKSGLYRANDSDNRYAVNSVDRMRWTETQVLIWDVDDSMWYEVLTSQTGYLPLSGGTMTGDIIGSNALSFDTVTTNADDSYIGKQATFSGDMALVKGFCGHIGASASNPPPGFSTSAGFIQTMSDGGTANWIGLFENSMKFNNNEVFSSPTRTSAQANIILDNADLSNVGKTAIASPETDLDLIVTSGYYKAITSTLNTPQSGYFTVYALASHATEGSQIAINIQNSETFLRRKVSGNWSAWLKLATTEDIPTTTTGDTATGGFSRIGDFYTEWGIVQLTPNATVNVPLATTMRNSTYNVSVDIDMISFSLEQPAGYKNKATTNFDIVSTWDANNANVNWVVQGFVDII